MDMLIYPTEHDRTFLAWCGFICFRSGSHNMICSPNSG